jgi:hypothetical protein
LQAGLEAAKTGGLCEVVVASDSSCTLAILPGGGFDHLQAWPLVMRDELTQYGVPVAGTGFVRTLDNVILDARWSATGAWNTQHKTFSFTLANNATAKFTTNLPGDRITFKWYDGGPTQPQTFSVTVNGGTPQTFANSATPGWRKYTLNASLEAGQSVVFKKLSGAYLSLGGVCVWNTSGGLLIHNVGQGGSTAHGTGTLHDRWDETVARESLGKVFADVTVGTDPPAAVIISLGGNDKMKHVPDASVLTAIEQVRGRWPDSDLIVVGETQLADSLVPRATWETWLDSLYEWAGTGVALVDQDARLGPYTQIVADGLNADASGHLKPVALTDLGVSLGALLAGALLET